MALRKRCWSRVGHTSMAKILRMVLSSARHGSVPKRASGEEEEEEEEEEVKEGITASILLVVFVATRRP